MNAINLVPGRECGECTLCCEVQNIDKPEVQKTSGSLCKNCVDGGCTIYETRYAVCRSFHCAWRQIADLDESWRPDRSGVFLDYQLLNGVTGLSLMLVGNPLKTVRQGWFVDYVQRAVRDGVPLVLALPGPIGMRSAKALLNNDEMRHAAAGSPEQVRQVLRKQVRALMGGDFEALTLLNTGNNVST